MSDATGAAEALLGLLGFRVVEVHEDPGEVVVVVELVAETVGCPGCGVVARAHGRTQVDYRALACFGRPARLANYRLRILLHAGNVRRPAMRPLPPFIRSRSPR